MIRGHGEERAMSNSHVMARRLLSLETTTTVILSYGEYAADGTDFMDCFYKCSLWCCAFTGLIGEF